MRAVWLLVLAMAVPAGAQTAPKTITNSIGMEFVRIEAGTFKMGADKNFEDASDHETPRHEVRISRPFYLAKTEVTQEQWVAVMGTNLSEYKGRTNPVENVSWEDAQAFIRKLNAKEGTSVYRLPTEAEWEYAARAGSSGKYSFGDEEDALGQHAWFYGNSGKTHPVAQLGPNPWGLYDMHGNVWEWVEDWYGESYYRSSPAADPRGPTSGSYRVFRGGSWYYGARSARAACRNGNRPSFRSRFLGFRPSRFLP